MNYVCYKEEYELSIVHPPAPYSKTGEKIRAAIGTLLDKAKVLKCVGCGKVHMNNDLIEVWMYDHEAGWKVDGLEERQWLSIFCDCGYHTSLNKLGVNRWQDEVD